MKRISFNWEISAGHVLQLIAMMCASLFFYGDAREYKIKMEMRVASSEVQILEMRKWVVEQSVVTQRLSENVVKLSTLVEERTATATARGKAFN